MKKQIASLTLFAALLSVNSNLFSMKPNKNIENHQQYSESKDKYYKLKEKFQKSFSEKKLDGKRESSLPLDELQNMRENIIKDKTIYKLQLKDTKGTLLSGIIALIYRRLKNVVYRYHENLPPEVLNNIRDPLLLIYYNDDHIVEQRRKKLKAQVYDLLKIVGALHKKYIISKKYFPDTSTIDLELKNKPSLVSAYDWCAQKAREFVKKKKKKILKLLDVTNKELSEMKNSETINKVITSKLEKKGNHFQCLPYYIRMGIYDTLQNKCVKEKLKITNIIENDSNNQLVVQREDGSSFSICQKPKEEKDPSALFVEKIKPGIISIFCSPEKLFDDTNRNDETIAAFFGHEIGHILRKHIIKYPKFRNICKYFYKSKNMCKYFYKSKNMCKYFYGKEDDLEIAFLEVRRAQEVEADIVGTFNNLNWTYESWNYFERKHEHESVKNLKLSTHPSEKQRAKYLKEMYLAMKKEETQHTTLKEDKKNEKK